VALALGKRIFLLTEVGREYAALVTGLPAVSDVTFVPFTLGRPLGAELSNVIQQAVGADLQCRRDAD
jgi:hypothetical protein